MPVLQIADNLKVQLTYNPPVDEEGEPLTPISAPSWASTDDTIMTATADDATGITATASTVAAPGVAGGLGPVSVTASATLPDGSTDLATFDFEVITSAEAAPGTITAGTPVPR